MNPAVTDVHAQYIFNLTPKALCVNSDNGTSARQVNALRPLQLQRVVKARISRVDYRVKFARVNSSVLVRLNARRFARESSVTSWLH